MLFSSVKKLLGWKSWLFWSLANFLSPLSKCYIINQDFFFAHRLEFVGKLPQNVSAVCCIEWFVASLQETLTPSVKQFLIVHRTEVELWWFLLLNIYIQWDFTVRKIRPVNTSFAMVGLKREKKKSSLCHLTSYVTFASHLSRVKIAWASNSGRFFSALLKIQFCVRNTL